MNDMVKNQDPICPAALHSQLINNTMEDSVGKSMTSSKPLLSELYFFKLETCSSRLDLELWFR